MLKLTALFFNTIALLIYQLFFADVVTITQNIPSTVKPGSEFTIELTVNKGTNSGFAKLQQDLPEGFTAVADITNGASFAFSNQSAKFIWMSLPNDAEFKVSYKVKVADNISGDKIIAGKFSFVADNVKQTIEIAPTTINVSASEETQPAVVAVPKEDIPQEAETPEATEYKQPSAADRPISVPAQPSGTDQELAINCFRNTPVTAQSPGEFPVEVTIIKGNLGGFAKFIERIPVGFTASVIDAKGAAFSFSDQKVKFVWGTLPKENEFKVSYKINVSPGYSGEQIIEGVFAFIENDRTKKFVLPQTVINLSEGAGQPAAPKEAVAMESTEEEAQDTGEATTSKNEIEDKFDATQVKSPQGNVNYKVQILALIKPKNKAKSLAQIAQILNVNDPIATELGDGYKKYTVGRHNEYKAARDAREQLPSQVAAPFVTAYNYGKRITVQEALMITSQQWVR